MSHVGSLSPQKLVAAIVVALAAALAFVLPAQADEQSQSREGLPLVGMAQAIARTPSLEPLEAGDVVDFSSNVYIMGTGSATFYFDYKWSIWYDGESHVDEEPLVAFAIDGEVGLRRLIRDTDYTLTFLDANGQVADLKDIGTYTARFQGIGTSCTGTRDVEFVIRDKTSIADLSVRAERASIDLDDASVPKDPEIIVFDSTWMNTLKKGVDYTVTYKNSAGDTVTSLDTKGIYTYTATGIGSYHGEKSGKFVVVGNKSIEHAFADLGVSDRFGYTGEPIKPTPTYTLDGEELKLGKDYTLSYYTNPQSEVPSGYVFMDEGTQVDPVDKGAYVVVARGKGEYLGENMR